MERPRSLESEASDKSTPFIGFYSASFLLLFFSNLAAAIQYVFQCMMGQNLSTIEFGLMNSLFQLSGFLALPITIYAAVIGRRWAELTHAGQQTEIDQMWCSFILLAGGICILISGITLLFTPWIAWWLKTKDILAIQLIVSGTALSTVFALAAPFTTARQWFSLLAFGVILNASLRLGIGWMGIRLQHSLYGGIIAQTFCGIVLFALVFKYVKYLGWNGISFRMLKFPRNEWTASLFLSLGTFFILGSDLLIVQRVYEPHESGIFAQVTVLARIIFFLIGPLAFVVFPKSATTHLAENIQTEQKILRRALSLGFLLLILAALGISLLAPLGFTLLRGYSDAEAVFYLRVAVWCFVPLSLCQLITPALFARRQERVLMEFTFLSALLPIGIAIFHDKLLHAFFVEGAVGLLLLIFTLIRWKTSSVSK